MGIDLRCPQCGRPSHAPDAAAGKRARCKCGAVFVIRAPDPVLAGLNLHEASTVPTSDTSDALSLLGISLEERPEREGRFLVMSPAATLPDRCVKCNAPAEGFRLAVTLRRGRTVANLLQLLLFLIFPILWLSSDQAEIEVGICRAHLNRVRRIRALGGCAFLASLGMILAGLRRGVEYGYVLLTGIALLLIIPIVTGLAGRLLTAGRIEPRRVWISGACAEFLASLPER